MYLVVCCIHGELPSQDPSLLPPGRVLVGKLGRNCPGHNLTYLPYLTVGGSCTFRYSSSPSPYRRFTKLSPTSLFPPSHLFSSTSFTTGTVPTCISDQAAFLPRRESSTAFWHCLNVWLASWFAPTGHPLTQVSAGRTNRFCLLIISPKAYSSRKVSWLWIFSESPFFVHILSGEALMPGLEAEDRLMPTGQATRPSKCPQICFINCISHGSASRKFIQSVFTAFIKRRARFVQGNTGHPNDSSFARWQRSQVGRTAQRCHPICICYTTGQIFYEQLPRFPLPSGKRSLRHARSWKKTIPYCFDLQAVHDDRASFAIPRD